MAEIQQIEVGFIKSELGKIDPAFAVSSKFNNQLGLFQPTDPKYPLEVALSYYQTLDCRPKLTFSPKDCSWDDVSCLLSEARSQYNAKGKGFAGSLRNLMRKAGDHADAIKPAVQLIPEDFGLSILRSSLAWVFTLLKQRSEYREKIFDTFEEIPRIIIEAESRKKDLPQLNHLTDNLYDALFRAMTKLIAYLLPKNQVFKVFPNFATTIPGSEIDLEINNVQKAVSILKERASTLREGQLVEMQKRVERTVRELQAGLNATRHNTVSTLLGSQALCLQVSQVEDIIQQIPDNIQSLQQSMDELVERFNTDEKATINEVTNMASHAGIEAQNYMTRMCKDMRQKFETMMEDTFQRGGRHLIRIMEMEVERARDLLPTSVTQHGLLSAQELLGILAAPPEEVTRDLKIVVQEGLQFSPAQQGQAQWLLEKDRFWQWFSATRSDLLLVHGNLLETSNGSVRTSSLSIVSATIASAIAQQANGDAIAVYYFCGLRMSSNDDLSGPQGLMRCLTSRLIVALKARYGIVANVNFVDGTYVEALQRRDVGYLCAIFCSIVAQYPSNATVYCILDGIAWYERPDMLRDLFSIVHSLYGLVEEARQGPVLKVLLTSPFRSRNALDMPIERQIFFNTEAIMLECEPSQRALFSRLGARTYEVAEYATTREKARIFPTDEDEQWTEEDYN